MVSQAFPGLKVQPVGAAKVVPRGPVPTPARGGKGWGKGKGTPSNTSAAGQVAQLRDMGFTDEVAKKALAECVWDVNKALDLLFTRGAEAFMSDASEVPMDACSSGNAKDRSGHDREDVGEISTTASTASSPRSANRTDVHSSSPLQESHESLAAPSEAANSCPTQEASVSPPVGLEQGADGAGVSEVPAIAEVAICEGTGIGVAKPVAAVLDQKQVAPLPSIDEARDVQGPKDAATEATSVSVGDSTVEVANDALAPRKRLEQVSTGWIGEDTVLTVSPKEFVLVWADTTTEHDWIYAEHVSDTRRFGWLPTFVFEVLPQHQKWMKVTSSQEAEHETQLEVRQGSVLKVSLHTRTEEGWVYAETVCDGVDHSPNGAGTAQAGWVPVFCFAWAEE